MQVVEQLPHKLKLQFQHKFTSVVDNHWCTADQSGFDRALPRPSSFEMRYAKNSFDLGDKAKLAMSQKSVGQSLYWRGKVAGGLTIALSMIEPKPLTAEDLKRIGIGNTNLDTKAMHVAIAALIDGGPMSKEEQRVIPEMVDEVVFDLRRRGYPWAASSLVLLVRFRDVESFVKSLDGHKNLVRSSSFKTRQVDDFVFDNKPLQLPLAWECTDLATPKGITILRDGVSCDQALAVFEDVSPSSLYQCANCGDAIGAQRLINAKACIELAKSENGLTALAVSARRNHTDVMEILLDAVPDAKRYANQAKNDGATPTYLAAQGGHEDAIQMLVKCRAEVNACRDDGSTPMLIAANLGHNKVVELLVRSQADVNQAQHDGWAPTCIAAYNGHTKVVDSLIRSWADLNQETNNGSSPIYVAAQNGHTDVIQKLICNRANINHANSAGQTATYIAARWGHDKVIAHLIHSKADIRQTTNNGWTSICIAVDGGHHKVVEQLIQNQVDINKATNHGSTAITIAANAGYNKVLEQLIKGRADVNQAQHDGWTPLCMAAFFGHDRAVEILIQSRAEINRTTNDGSTPAYIAAMEGHGNVVDRLIQRRADINQANKEGITPASTAAERGHMEAAVALIDGKADINRVDKEGRTPLFMAAQVGHTEVVDQLIRKKGCINQSNNYGSSALLVAAQNGHSEAVELLIRSRANINHTNNAGCTPTFVSAQNGHIEVLDQLMRRRADINQTNHDGLTPISIAHQNRHTFAVEMLGLVQVPLWELMHSEQEQPPAGQPQALSYSPPIAVHMQDQRQVREMVLTAQQYPLQGSNGGSWTPRTQPPSPRPQQVPSVVQPSPMHVEPYQQQQQSPTLQHQQFPTLQQQVEFFSTSQQRWHQATVVGVEANNVVVQYKEVDSNGFSTMVKRALPRGCAHLRPLPSRASQRRG